jgi:hypothetical protein
MKISLSIVFLVTGFFSYGQINQRTIVLREQYTKETALNLKQRAVPEALQKTFLYSREIPEQTSTLSTDNYFNPSSHSIERAFSSNSGLKRQPDYSRFLLLSYSALTNQQIHVNPREDNSFRFFPVNMKD